MINQPIQVFKLMYLALDEIWQKDKNELLGLYLSEADPFLTGFDSADPAVYCDFLKCFEKCGNYYNYGYDFILEYLSQLDSYYGDIKKYFQSITKEDFSSQSEFFSKMTDQEIIRIKNWTAFYPNID